MTEGVDDGLAHGFAGYFRDIFTVEPFQTHADVDVLEDILLGFLDQFKDIAVEVVAVNNGGAVGCGKDSAAQLHGGGFGKKQRCGIEQPPLL